MYPSQCHLRATACSSNTEIFEVPCSDDEREMIGEGSGGEFDCEFGGEPDERADIFDDEEFGNQCKCNWHCRPNGSPVLAEGKLYDSQCELYRDGFCKLQRNLRIDSLRLCDCQDEVGVLDNEFCGADGGCLCRPRFTGRNCEFCASNHYLSGSECRPCGCSSVGSYDKTCGSDGKCSCNEGYTGEKCQIEIPLEECESCTLDQLKSEIQCGDNFRIYNSLCAMHQLHCRQQMSDRPSPLPFYECYQSVHPVTTATPAPTQTAAVITLPIRTLTSAIVPTVTTERTVMTTESYEASGQGSDCDDDEFCGGSGDGNEEYNDKALANTPNPGEKYLNMVTYDIKLYLRNGRQNQTAIHDEFIEILRKQFPSIMTVSIFNHFLTLPVTKTLSRSILTSHPPTSPIKLSLASSACLRPLNRWRICLITLSNRLMAKVRKFIKKQHFLNNFRNDKIV